MDFIIDFFKGIDGIAYYIILVVNTILIFAIIGYLGEKNNEKILKMSMNATGVNSSNQPIGNTPVSNANTNNNQGGVSIPKVAATQVNIHQNEQSTTQQNISVSNGLNNDSIAQPSVINNQLQPNLTSTSMTNNSQILSNNVSNQPGVIRAEDNEVDPNEKAPAVLIINSNNNNKI